MKSTAQLIFASFLTFGAVFSSHAAKLAGAPPVTVPFDKNLRFASLDLPLDHPRIVRTVTGMTPEQVSITLAGPGAVYVSWATGEGRIKEGSLPTPHNISGEANSEVRLGVRPGHYREFFYGVRKTYNQVYGKAQMSYTSPILHTVKVDGLLPLETYYYSVGDGIGEYGPEHSFTFPRPVGTFPQRILYFGDMGTTWNSTSTLDHILESAKDPRSPPVVAFMGDYTYSDTYCTNGTYRLDPEGDEGRGSPIKFECWNESFQPRWDAWGRLMEPLISKYPFLPVWGNHEIEPQADGSTFAAARARYPTPHAESLSAHPSWYSFEVSGVHYIHLNNYLDFKKGGEQYVWLEEDLKYVDRSKTPFIIVHFHAPWYNTYATHYKENECMRLEGYEELFFEFGVNAVFHGHVHAYERIHPVYNYTVDPCAPAYVTVGDAGNSEGTYAFWADEPGECPDMQYTQCPTFQDEKFCPDSQPEWSAYREPSFGHGTLDLINATHALWTWHRNQDGAAVAADSAYIIRNVALCENQARRSVTY